MELNEFTLEILDHGEVTKLSKLFFYNSLSVHAIVSPSGEVLSCDATTSEETPVQMAITDAYKLVKGKNPYNFLTLQIEDKSLQIDKKTKPEETMFEYNHYEELYGTAPEHLK